MVQQDSGGARRIDERSENRSTVERKRNRTIPAGNNSLIKNFLRNIFGIKQLRPGQKDVIESVMQGNDTLAIVPTGAGKSLCYQLPALIFPGVTLVVSPLISLMNDQVSKLEETGISATQLNSMLNRSEQDAALESIEKAQSKIVFTTPERLADLEFIKSLKTNRIDLFVIDEVHCISQWGHDFRPAYLELSGAIDALGRPPVLALTATATENVTADIIKQLGLKNTNVINTGIFRRNLHYQVIQATNEDEKRDETIRLIQQAKGAGVVYAATVKAAEALHDSLHQAGESVTLYHGKLRAKERKENQNLFMQGERRIMVATNAFGMGIDKSDIRFVIHYQVPANLEAYYQESGRAGRDGEIAHCTLLYYLKDKRVQQFFLAKHYPDANDMQETHGAIKALAQEKESVSVASVQEALGKPPIGKVKVMLKLLKEGGLITQDNSLRYHLIETSIELDTFKQLANAYQEKQEHDRIALERMVFYAQTGFCRWKILLDYFDAAELKEGRCGACDNCMRAPEQILSNVELPMVENHAGPKGQQSEASLLEVGSMVSVPKFEEGRVVSIDGDKVTIEFANTETRTFLREYVEPA